MAPPAGPADRIRYYKAPECFFTAGILSILIKADWTDRIQYVHVGLALYLIGIDVLVNQMDQLTASQVPYSVGHQRNSRRMEATFAGPLTASRWFFTGANATSPGTTQWSHFIPHPCKSNLGFEDHFSPAIASATYLKSQKKL
ncbi:uncharacterized protein BJ212DRAFT_1299839 [Suillus subaureus]|uniref:Uncharacterized protein n=1 Tax=Suillus subaureus TaxID=48587 RepID=A0A9P7JDE9_9AGAM|nr:uncharacterized protein BJ212DRAFT_1299839 [Suillus subaureus]KAG1815983.1 hypothetical protein BJ212DRAFT_1299839 [Suillus subaureus]